MNLQEFIRTTTLSDHHQNIPLHLHIRTMSGGARNPSFKLQALVTFFRRIKISPSAATSGGGSSGCYSGRLSQPVARGYRRDKFFSSCNLGYAESGLRSFSTGTTKAVKKDEGNKTQPSLPVPDKQGFSGWAKWLLGSFLTLFLPFLKLKWERLRALEENVEKVAEEAEVMAEMVEEAATTAEKVSSEVAEKIPDNTKIKQAVLIVEHLSTVTAQEAKLTEDFIHRIGEVKQDLEEMKTIAEPVIDKIVESHLQPHNTPSSDHKQTI